MKDPIQFMTAVAAVKEVNVTAFSRHSTNCKPRHDRDYLSCTCPKHAEWSVAGKQKRVSLHTRDRETALSKTREMMNSFALAAKGEVIQPKPDAGKTVEEAIDHYLTTKSASGFGEKYVSQLKTEYKRMEDVLLSEGVLHVAAVRTEHL